MVQFKDLPVEIQNRMLDEQIRQRNPRNAEVFEVNIFAGDSKGGFDWDESMEEYDFWEEILVSGDFTGFYEKYPKVPNKLYSEEEVRDLFIRRCKKFSTEHEKFFKILLEQDLKWFEENKK